MIAESFEELGINFNYSAFAISSLISSLLVLVVGFAFRSIGVYVMSKKQGLSTPWLSFVPFLGYVQLGKLIGPAKIFGMRMKNTGWLVFAFLLASTAAEAAYDVLYCWKDFLFIIVKNKIPAATADATIGEYILVGVNYLLSLGYIVAFVFSAILFFRYYSKNSVAGFTVLSVFFEFMFGILVFVCRNNDKKDLNAERRAFEEKLKSRGGFYGSGNGGFYGGNNGDFYGGQPGTRYGEEKREDKDGSPFSEYADTYKNDDVFEEYSARDKNKDDKKNNDNSEDDLF